MAPITGSLDGLGTQQADWARLAVADFDRRHRVAIRLDVGDTRLEPGQSAVLARRFVADSAVVAVVGPSSAADVAPVGPLFARATMAFVSPSASSDALFTGIYPTFFATVAKHGEEGVFAARFIAGPLRARHVVVVDDGSPYSIDLTRTATRTLVALGVGVTSLSVTQSEVDYRSLVAHLPADVTVAYVPWEVAGEVQILASELAAAHRRVIIVGGDDEEVPLEFHARGAYVPAFGPLLSESGPAGAVVRHFVSTYHQPVTTAGPPAYVATTVVLDAIESACASGHPSRAAVLAAVRATHLRTSLVGRPVVFNRYGLQLGATLYMLRIGRAGYVEVPTSGIRP
jgi:branched-chain amino acid transport system substrate-binding protein